MIENHSFRFSTSTMDKYDFYLREFKTEGNHKHKILVFDCCGSHNRELCSGVEIVGNRLWFVNVYVAYRNYTFCGCLPKEVYTSVNYDTLLVEWTPNPPYKIREINWKWFKSFFGVGGLPPTTLNELIEKLQNHLYSNYDNFSQTKIENIKHFINYIQNLKK